LYPWLFYSDFSSENPCRSKIHSAEVNARKIIEEAGKDAEGIKREAILEAKEEVHKARNDLDKEVRERSSELQRVERRLQQKEETIDKKVETLRRKKKVLLRKIRKLTIRESINDLKAKQVAELERLSGLTSEEARKLLLSNVEEEIKHEAAMLIKDIEIKRKKKERKRPRTLSLWPFNAVLQIMLLRLPCLWLNCQMMK
jgi:ribonucrease Y